MEVAHVFGSKLMQAKLENDITYYMIPTAGHWLVGLISNTIELIVFFLIHLGLIVLNLPVLRPMCVCHIF